MTDRTTLSGLMRTHNCGELKGNNLGENVTLCGWVNKYRDLGGLHFIDIRDKFGLTQIAFDEFPGDLAILKSISLETVIEVSGNVRRRPESAINSRMETGEIEISAQSIKILSKAKEPPFLPYGQNEPTEEMRLKYRYLDIRSAKMQKMLSLRSKTLQKTRQFLSHHHFTEVDTPILYKTTPEGARDYIVPSRVHKGKVYALPQSPQTLKQLLMIGGLDKYFQLCRCFRDEDLRADRQPEFTQIDIEVSFPTQDYMKNLARELIKEIFSLSEFDFPTLDYADAIALYGSDKPDTRFGLAHIDVTNLFKQSGFSLFETVAQEGGLIKAIYIPKEYGDLPRKEIDNLKEIVAPCGANGVAFAKVNEKEVSGGIAKFITQELLANLMELKKEGGHDGLWLFVAHKNPTVTHESMDLLRRYLGKKLNLLKEGYSFLWVNNFPLLEYGGERFFAVHHPFTMPHHKDLDLFYSNSVDRIKQCRAEAYDVVCNGYELGGGSLRIYDNSMQEQMFTHLGLSKEEAEKQFGFFLEALKYGTPPHGGIAFGFDRIIMLLCGIDNIRDAIAFPKTTAAMDLMAGSPSEPAPHQLQDLHFDWKK